MCAFGTTRVGRRRSVLLQPACLPSPTKSTLPPPPRFPCGVQEACAQEGRVGERDGPRSRSRCALGEGPEGGPRAPLLRRRGRRRGGGGRGRGRGLATRLRRLRRRRRCGKVAPRGHLARAQRARVFDPPERRRRRRILARRGRRRELDCVWRRRGVVVEQATESGWRRGGRWRRCGLRKEAARCRRGGGGGPKAHRSPSTQEWGRRRGFVVRKNRRIEQTGNCQLRKQQQFVR